MVKMHKKSNAILDTMIVVVFLVAIIICAWFGNLIVNKFNDNWKTLPTSTSESLRISQQNADKFAVTWDGLIIFIFVGLWIAVIISSFQINSHPVFFGITVIVMAFVLIVAAILSNAAHTIYDNNTINQYAASFVYSFYIIDHYVLFALAIGFSILISIYSKSGGQSF